MRDLVFTDKEFYKLCVKNKTLSELSYLYFKLVEKGDKRAKIVKQEEEKKIRCLLRGVLL